MFPSRKSGGFTLIELLVVIAIISILAAILFPVFARARENARRTSCISNLKQVGLGIMQYTQDYDERLPSSWANNTEDSNHTVIYYTEPYVKSIQVFKCPSDTFQGPYSYGYNYFYLAPQGLKSAVSLAQITVPAQTVMMTDDEIEAASRDYVYAPANWKLNGGSIGTNDYGYVSPRHLEMVSTLWADGHVKAQKISSLNGAPGCSGTACDTLWDLQ